MKYAFLFWTLNARMNCENGESLTLKGRKETLLLEQLCENSADVDDLYSFYLSSYNPSFSHLGVHLLETSSHASLV